MKKETFDIVTNIASLISVIIAVVSYCLELYNHAIYFMCFAIYLKE